MREYSSFDTENKPKIEGSSFKEKQEEFFEIGQGGDEEDNLKKEKVLKVMNKWAYKEVAQKGGMKWYLGEPEEEVLTRQAEKLALKESSFEVVADSPMPISSTEQNTKKINDNNEGHQQTEKSELTEDTAFIIQPDLVLQEGQSLVL